MLQPTFGIISLFDGSKLLNENSTILHPLTNSTQNRSLNIEISDQMSFQSLPWWCYYSSDLSDNEDESECHCEGTKLLKIPQNLPQITRLSIGEQTALSIQGKFSSFFIDSSKRKIQSIKRSRTQEIFAIPQRFVSPFYSNELLKCFQQYFNFIGRFFTNLNDFYQIEPGAFKNILHLRTMQGFQGLVIDAFSTVEHYNRSNYLFYISQIYISRTETAVHLIGNFSSYFKFLQNSASFSFLFLFIDIKSKI